MPKNNASSKLYYVVVDGQKLGPFDKRTVTGMRVKRVLQNESQIHDEDGNYTTVIELLGQPTPLGPSTGGTETLGASHPCYAVTLLKPATRPYAGMSFKGDGEVRLLGDVLRVAGHVKTSFWGKAEGARVRIPNWHLEQMDRAGKEVALFAPQYNAQDNYGSVRMKFGSEAEAQDFEAQMRYLMPWLV